MRRLVALLLVLVGVICSAQSPLYRGRVMLDYDFAYNGNYYWFNSEYKPGTVCYNGTVYEGVSINVNAHTQEVLVQENGFSSPVVLDRDLLPWFELNGIYYVNLNLAGMTEAPKGYFQILSDGRRTVYYQRLKNFARDAGNHNGIRGIGYEDPYYKPELCASFLQNDCYYVVRNGKFTRIYPGRHKRAGMTPEPLPDMARVQTDSPRTLTAPGSRSAVAPSGLPTGWFSDNVSTTDRTALLAAIEQEKLIANYRNKTYEIGTPSAGGGPVKVSGTVRDVASGEALGGVLVSDSSERIYCYSAPDGSYELKLPLGDNVLKFREYSKEDMDIRVIVKGQGALDVIMREKVIALKSAYVTANSMMEHRRTGMGLEKMNSATLTHIPSAFGEGDVLKAVLTLPGVKSVGEASGGFNVRGGSADQNLILFNGGTIYNPSHFFGIFSAFNTDVVDDIELYKSSIPVEFGGRISSVLDISSRDGDPERIRGSIGLGILTSNIALEGPIVKNKTTFVLGGRTTYSDWLLNLLPAESGYAGGKASFSDVNLGITHRLDKHNTLKATGYWSRDGFSFKGDTTFRYSNLNFALKWMHESQSGNTVDVIAGYDNYSNTMDRFSEANAPVSYRLDTRIQQAFTRAKARLSAGSHSFTLGADAVFYALDPGAITPYEGSLVTARTLARETALEPSVYLSDLWQPGSGAFSLEYGVRYSSFLALSPVKYYGTPEFRIGGKYSPVPNLSVKAGFNTMSQYIHLVSNTSSISPMDTWKLCDADILPQSGFQAAGGVYWTVFGNAMDISLEGYYKRSYNYLDYKSGAVLSMNEHLADDLVRTTGRSYGVELMLRKQTGRLTGWVSYTWSRALLKEMEDRGLETINGGDWYNAPYDKPHDVKLVGNYKFTHRYSLSFNLDYSTGRPVTVPVGQYVYGNAVRLMYSERNAHRIPDYFRLDLAFNIEPGHYLKAFTHMSATIGCYNVTGRRNAYSVFYTAEGGKMVQGYMLSVFATQVPYLSIKLKF
ncbi:MAG: TonB-dependent receptor [Bacteroidales bacterium]|nr:TonB-dependent receptor [Bacteroidales bacterium]